MASTLLQKVWDAHTVRVLPDGQTQLFIGLHLVHEVTSPQAFDMLRTRGWGVSRPDRTFATVDHIVPTRDQRRPFGDLMAEDMLAALERNCREHGIELFDLKSGRQGIVHVIGPELGLTQPGMTIACGDSHTSTHGAFGAIAFGIGTSQVRDVLASQCLAMNRLKVRRISVTGALGRGVYAKDVILEIIRRLGVQGGVGFAYEYGGAAVDAMTQDERMTICNMSIEGGARVGYVNPDETTFRYLEGRPFAPRGEAFDRAQRWWTSLRSDPGASYDDEVTIEGESIRPTVTFGINPGQSVGVDERIPSPSEVSPDQRASLAEALEFMGFTAGAPIAGTPVDVAFIGSCTNARLSDLREAARSRRGAPRVRPRACARRSRLPDGPPGGRTGRTGPRLPRRRVRVARRRLLDVPRHEPGPARRPRDLRIVVQPELQRAAGKPYRPDTADEPGDGGRGRDRRRSRRRQAALLMSSIDRIAGTALPLRGDSIDTDRIMPARFLRAITFSGLEAHLFEDDRREADARAASARESRIPFPTPLSRTHDPDRRRQLRLRLFTGTRTPGTLSAGLACDRRRVLLRNFLFELRRAGAPVRSRLTRRGREADDSHRDGAVDHCRDIALGDAAHGRQGALRHFAAAGTRESFLTGQWDATGLLLREPDAIARVGRASALRHGVLNSF